MYLLTAAVLVNWHSFEPVELPFARLTAVIGENRSGKSTLLDAIQVAMLGNHGQWRSLNSAAGDERSKRTVRNYALGMLAPGQPPLRESAVTWIALHFKDEETNHDVSIGLYLTASVQDSAVFTNWFVLPGLRVRLSDLADEAREDGEVLVEPLDWDTAMHRLDRKAAAVKGAEIMTPTGPEKYVGEWMKAMRAGGRSPRPETFAKAFVNAVGYRAVTSDDQFFKRFLLPHKPIDIAQLRASIATYREVDARIKATRREIAYLREAARESGCYLEESANAEAENWIAARAEAQHGWRHLRKTRTRRADKLETARLAKTEQQRAEEQLEQARKDHADLQARINQTTHGQLQQIAAQEANARHERDTANRDLGAWFKICRDAAAAGREGMLAGTARFASLVERLGELASLTGGEAAAFPADAGRIRQVLSELGDVEPAAEHLSRVARQCYAEQDKAQRAHDEAEDKLRRLRAGQAPVGEETVAFLEALREKDFEPEVLCALVSVTDESWRDAAEALLGAEREAVILPPEQVEPAIRFWRASGGRFRRCRIARTDKVAPDAQAGESGAMDSIVVAGDPLVAGFLRRRIGGVRLAETVEDLRAHGRAIMRDCYYDDGLSVRRLGRRGPPLLGREVGAKADCHLAGEMERLAREARTALRDGERHDAASRALRSLAAAIAEEREPVDRLDNQRQRAEERLDALREQRIQAEGSIDPDWTADLKRLSSLIRDLQDARDQAAKELTAAELEAEQAEATLGMGEEQLGSTAFFALRLYRLKQAGRAVPEVASGGMPARGDLRRTFRERLRKDKGEPKSVAHHARQERDGKRKAAEAARDAFWSRVREYQRNVASPEAEKLQSGKLLVSEADSWIRERIEKLEGDTLIKHEAQMERAAEELSTVFQTSFVAEIRDRMEIVQNEVERIGAILRPHEFHKERYRFRYQISQDYEGLIQLAQADSSRLMTLFEGGGEAAETHSAAIEAVKELLLSNDLDTAAFEDYRNYWTFWLESAQVGTGKWVSFQARKGINSGAESQTPFYIAMAAALAAAYRSGGHGRSYGGMGLALFDEAFSKMDPNNQRRMLDFFADIGLQPVVAAPLSGQTGLVPRMDQIHEVWRSGDHATVESYRPGQALKEAIEREDPSTLTREQLLEMAAGEGGADAPGAAPE